MSHDSEKLKNVLCLECRNDVPIHIEDIRLGYFFECPFCGITMEIKEVKPDGSLRITIVELEK